MPEYVWVITGVILGVVGILSFRVRFDINEWLRDRRQSRLNQLKTLCPHAEPVLDEDGKPAIDSLFTPLAGTISWQCGRCGTVVHSRDTIERQMAHLLQHADIWLEREQKFQKLAKKLGYN